LNSEPE